MGAEYRPGPPGLSEKSPAERTTGKSDITAAPERGGTVVAAPAPRAAGRTKDARFSTFRPLTYGDLKEHHLKRIRLDEEGRERPNAVLKNHRSVINGWTGFLLERAGAGVGEGAGDALPLGEEIGALFPTELADYLEALVQSGRQKSTVGDRKSIMWTVHESAVELIKLQGLPEGFAEALSHLIDESGLSNYHIAHKLSMGENVLSFWRQGRALPSPKSLPKIERLEDLFGVQRGTLSGRLPHFGAVCVIGRPVAGMTPWREHQGKLHKHPYGLKALPPKASAEYDDLVRFYTDDVWLEQRGLRRNSEWRIRRNRGKSPTAGIMRKRICYYLGYLSQPPDEDRHPWQRGRGFAVDSLSLALLGDADLTISFVEFLRERTYSKSFNTSTSVFLMFCATLLRRETGFLRQQPAYGLRLPEPVPAREWDAWCEANRERLVRFLKAAKKSKNRPFRKTRDPFAPVRNIIEERQHPISALMEMAANMKRMIPLRAQNGPEFLAVHMRNLAFAEFITSYPLRVENFSLMMWAPKNPADVLAYDKPYIETEEESNLYQKSDGSWWIRFGPEEIKNAKGVDVPVARSVVPTLRDYLFRHRPVINRAIRRALKSYREELGLAPLTRAEERAIEFCPFVFRPCPLHVRKKSLASLGGYKGVDQIRIGNLSQALFVMTQKYIPGCMGFRPHAVRHIVASEYIKNYPNGYAVAAAALNITEKVVREHYAWVRPCDQIKPWQDYHESLREQFESGACLS